MRSRRGCWQSFCRFLSELTIPDGLPLAIPTAEDIRLLELAMREHPAQIQIETTHAFGEGTYCRTMIAPEGALIVGKRHRDSCVNIISEGSIVVWSEHGAKRIDGPCVFESPPGTKRVGYVLKKTIWTTAHANPSNDKNLDSLEDRLIHRETLNPPPRYPEIDHRL
jgi:hypothetical protein